MDHANPAAGTKLTQVNAFDLNGNIPDGMQNQMMPHMISINIAGWNGVFAHA